MKAKIKLYETIGQAYLQYARDLEAKGPASEAPAVELAPQVAEEPKAKKAKKAEAKTEAPKLAVVAEEIKEEEPRKFFTSDNPPKTAAEIKLWQGQWAAMSKEQQEAYTRGEVASNIASLQAKIDAHAAEKVETKVDPVLCDDLDDLADLGDVIPAVVTFTKDQVREALKAFAMKNGRDAAYAILDQFGSRKVDEIGATKYAALMAELA